MNHVELEIADWIYGRLGLCYIEESYRKPLKNDPSFKEEIKKLKIAIDNMRDLYNPANDNEGFQKLGTCDTLKRAFERNDEADEIIKSRKLLEKNGYNIIRGK